MIFFGIFFLEYKIYFYVGFYWFYKLYRTLEKMGKDFFSFRDEEVKNLGRGDVKGY